MVWYYKIINKIMKKYLTEIYLSLNEINNNWDFLLINQFNHLKLTNRKRLVLHNRYKNYIKMFILCQIILNICLNKILIDAKVLIRVKKIQN